MQREDVLLTNLYTISETLGRIAEALEPVVVLTDKTPPRCDNCFFWDGSHCRCHAPIVVQRGEKVWSGWPLAEGDEWCGEWRAA